MVETPDTALPTVEILLPSDKEWRMKNYYKLVEKQRSLACSPMPAVWPEKAKVAQWDAPQPVAKRPRRSSVCSDISTDSGQTLQDSSLTVFDIAKAGSLLAPEPVPTSFEDEEEMRRIYSLIYDVFRYKSVLNQALIDTTFFHQYPQYKKSANLVWLMFYDLYKRRFLQRDSCEDDKRVELFDAVGLTDIDDQLWQLRVRLAAAVARLRIKNNALHLTQLLPPHLRDDRVIALDEAFVTGWINTFKLKKDDITKVIEKSGLNPIQPKQEHLARDNYQFDHLCPKFILCHPAQRLDLAQSNLVRKHQVILQDRAFCLGPAIMCRVLADMELTGYVAQTHINSPRTTAYLANILADNDKIEKLLAFGAGERKTEYEEYLRQLGVTNIQILAERFVDMAPESDLLSSVSAVLATPPNTYSGVIDPVDLVCSRGGDLNMLEVLTETELGSGSRGRINLILEEQQQTLRLSMSKPQIQVVLYETHSIVTAENGDMVMRLINEMNQNARDRHAEEQGKGPQTPTQQITDAGTVGHDSSERLKIETFPDVEIPPCDLFEIGTMPDLCPNGDMCLNLEEEGCYMALLQRKEIVRLDAKYMIKIAESRGLFGGDVKKSPSGRTHKRKEMMTARSGSGGSLAKQRGRRCKIEMERIAAPTQASLLRRVSAMTGEISEDGTCSTTCQRHQKHSQECNKVSEARRQDVRRWWGETARHIRSMDEHLRLKISSPDQETHIPVLRLTRTHLESSIVSTISLMPSQKPQWDSNVDQAFIHQKQLSDTKDRPLTLLEQEQMVHRHSKPTQTSNNRMVNTRKMRLNGQRFASNSDVHEVVTLFMQKQPWDFYEHGITRLVCEWYRCLNAGGDYFDMKNIISEFMPNEEFLTAIMLSNKNANNMSVVNISYGTDDDSCLCKTSKIELISKKNTKSGAFKETDNVKKKDYMKTHSIRTNSKTISSESLQSPKNASGSGMEVNTSNAEILQTKECRSKDSGENSSTKSIRLRKRRPNNKSLKYTVEGKNKTVKYVDKVPNKVMKAFKANKSKVSKVSKTLNKEQQKNDMSVVKPRTAKMLNKLATYNNIKNSDILYTNYNMNSSESLETAVLEEFNSENTSLLESKTKPWEGKKISDSIKPLMELMKATIRNRKENRLARDQEKETLVTPEPITLEVLLKQEERLQQKQTTDTKQMKWSRMNFAHMDSIHFIGSKEKSPEFYKRKKIAGPVRKFISKPHPKQARVDMKPDHLNEYTCDLNNIVDSNSMDSEENYIKEKLKTYKTRIQPSNLIKYVEENSYKMPLEMKLGKRLTTLKESSKAHAALWEKAVESNAIFDIHETEAFNVKTNTTLMDHKEETSSNSNILQCDMKNAKSSDARVTNPFEIELMKHQKHEPFISPMTIKHKLKPNMAPVLEELYGKHDQRDVPSSTNYTQMQKGNIHQKSVTQQENMCNCDRLQKLSETNNVVTNPLVVEFKEYEKYDRFKPPCRTKCRKKSTKDPLLESVAVYNIHQ